MQWVRSSTFVESMVREATGASYPAVSDRVVKASHIPLPPLDEQRRIAAILDKADALRRKRKHAFDLLNNLTQIIFNEMFSGDLLLKTETILDIADIKVGFPFSSNEYTSDPAGVRLCRGANVLPGRTDWSDERRWPKNKAADCEEYKLLDGDVVVAMDRPWISEGFKVAQIRPGDLPGLLVQRVARLRAKSSKDSHFLYALIRHPVFSVHCKPTETTIPHISPLEIRNFSFGLPKESRRETFADLVEHLRPAKEAALVCKSQMEALFNSLQHRAFSGQL